MKRLLLLVFTVVSAFFAQAQLLTWTPSFPKEDDPAQTLEIIVDATKGNNGLLNQTPVSDVYVHTGVITSLSTGPTNWKYVKFSQDFNQPNPQLQAVSLGNNKWKFTIQGSLKTYYGVPATESIQKIAILFRSGNGSKKQTNTDGTDMYIPVYGAGLAVRLTQPSREAQFSPLPEKKVWSVGDNVTIAAESNQAATQKLYFNGTILKTTDNTTSSAVSATLIASGNQQFVVEATAGGATKYDTINIFVSGTAAIADLPSGVRDGINYWPGTDSLTLVLRAPGKSMVTVIGDFNNWAQAVPYEMKKTPDGKFFWLTLKGLAAGTEYGYQYLVDGTTKIADPYTEKILDPNNDPFIPATTYPNLKPYPTGKTTGIVSVLQPGQPAYNWTVNNFSRPDKRGLVIYELLVRDFIAAHDWKTLKDTLSYLKRLGVNAIEVMPFNEFEGNLSWGYNGYQYFAPDKYYGPKNTLKEFIDACHQNGIAVIMDMVLNHTYGPSPLKDLYGLANNPWYNPTAPHAAINFGDDFNHESADTKYFFDRVLQHWLTEYKIDGYRFDFTKGLTQKMTTSDAALSAYDASRIAILKGYYDVVKSATANPYVILEHFCDNTEEKELSGYGMMLWADYQVWTAYQEASMGFVDKSNFDWGFYTSRGWSNPHLVTFMESHDEERITYKNEKYGNAAGSYNIKEPNTALRRMELNAAFLLTIPGPKMIWEFGELGYDYSRCYQSTNGEGGDCNKKTDPKPIRWDYQTDPNRKHVFDTYSQLIRLRFLPSYAGVFQSASIQKDVSSAFKWIKLTTASDTSDLVVIGNFDVVPQTGTVSFPTSGTWYDYFGNFIQTATGAPQSFTLQPGEFHVYVNRNVNNVTATPVGNVPWNGSTLALNVYPNPVKSAYTIKLALPQSGNTTIELYNSMGQYLSAVYSGFLQKGERQLPLQRPSVASGTYYLKLQVKGETKTIPITLQ